MSTKYPAGWTCPACGRQMQRAYTPHNCNGQFRKHWPAGRVTARKRDTWRGYVSLFPLYVLMALAALVGLLVGRKVKR